MDNEEDKSATLEIYEQLAAIKPQEFRIRATDKKILVLGDSELFVVQGGGYSEEEQPVIGRGDTRVVVI
jgi:hypothetical protein